MRKVPELLLAMNASGLTGRQIADRSDIPHSILSRVLNRRALLDRVDAVRLGRVLKTAVANLGPIVRDA